jgi:hypothetical protein
MAIVEYAKYGNLRDYLRNKRIHSYFVFNLQRNITAKNHISNLLTLLSSSTSSHDKEDESIDFRDLVNFAYQIALGMDYLHAKKVFKKSVCRLIIKHLNLFSYSTGIWQHEMYLFVKIVLLKLLILV